MVRRTLVTMAVAALTFCAHSAVWENDANAQEEFKIGVVASLTGQFAGPAHDSMEGLQAWIDRRGLEGRTIVLEVLDDETNPVGASNAFRRVASDPDVRLIYAMVPSGSVLAIKSLASEFEIPLITAGAADAIGFPANPWLFKVAPAVRDFMIVVANYAEEGGYQRIAMFNGTDAFGQAEIDAMRELAPENGLEIVAAESYSADDTNFNAQLTRIRAANPDIIYSGAIGRSAILFYKQFQQMGIDAHLVMGQSVVTSSFFEGIGGAEQADGLMVPIQLGSFGPSIGGESAALYNELAEQLGHQPNYFNTFGYDVGLITEAAVANSDGTPQSIRDALEALQGLPAVNGPVTYVPDNHTGQNDQSIAIGRLENGIPVLPE